MRAEQLVILRRALPICPARERLATRFFLSGFLAFLGDFLEVVLAVNPGRHEEGGLVGIQAEVLGEGAAELAFLAGGKRGGIAGAGDGPGGGLEAGGGGDERLDVLAEVLGGAKHGAHRVVQLVGHPGGEVAEGRHLGGIDEAVLSLAQLLEGGGQLVALAGKPAVEHPHLGLQLGGAGVAPGQRAHDDGNEEVGQLRVLVDRLADLLAAEDEGGDLGEGAATVEYRVLQGEGHQADDAPGARGVEGDLFPLDGAEELDAPAEDDPDGAGFLALAHQHFPRRVGAAPGVAEDAVEAVDHRFLHFLVGEAVIADDGAADFAEAGVEPLEVLLCRPEGTGKNGEVEQGVEVVDEVRGVVRHVVGELPPEELAEALAGESGVEAGVHKAALEEVVDGGGIVQSVEEDLAGAPEGRLRLHAAEEVLASQSRSGEVAEDHGHVFPVLLEAEGFREEGGGRIRHRDLRHPAGEAAQSVGQPPGNAGVGVDAEEVAAHGETGRIRGLPPFSGAGAGGNN